MVADVQQSELPDVVGVCLECQALYLLPVAPIESRGLCAAGLCPDCNGLVVGVEPAERRLADVVSVVRAAERRHAATLRQLVDSWEVAVPSPLAALAELGPVAPDVLDVLDLGSVTATTRRAIGTVVVAVMPALLRAAAGRRDPDTAARRVLAGVTSTERLLPMPT